MLQRPATTQTISYVLRKDKNSNGHLLGVNALAFDSTTPTALDGTPGGILYTAGRDGMIAAWDVHLESPVDRGIPGESLEHPKGLSPSTFRQSFNHHTDWVNDIVLCHDGGSLISASSDRTVKLVRPHSDSHSTPHLIGTHGDYVKTLAYAPSAGWIASGGLDRTVNIWDLREGRSDPIGNIPETSSKASIYALACNPTGSVLATGSPEKVIRVWDPRSGKRITKFTGHTDNIRALLVSENGDTILSASSDTTIKLWSLTAQRCITTFTMYADSVWSLYSDHPRLETFYSGSKDGLVTKTEICRGGGNDDDDGDSGECIVLCKADAGVARIVAHDDSYIWTATSSSSVCQWPDIPRVQDRAEELQSSIVPANLLKLNLGDSTFLEPVHEQYYPTSTVYSAASFTSYTVAGYQRDRQSQHSSEDDDGLIMPLFSAPENVIEGEHGLVKHTLLNNRRMVVTEDKCGEIALWDIIRCVQLKTFTDRKLDDVVNELNTNESVPTWCTVDTRIGALTVHLEESRCFDAEVYADEVDPYPNVERPEDQRIIVGKWVLRNLFRHYIPVHIDAYEKEQKRQQELEVQQQKQQQQAAIIPTTVITNEKNEVVSPSQVYQPQAVHGRVPSIDTALANSVYTGTSSAGNTSVVNSRSTSPRSSVVGTDGANGANVSNDTSSAPADTMSPRNTLSQPTTPGLPPVQERSGLLGSPSIPSTPTGVFSPTSPSATTTTFGSGSKDKDKDKEGSNGFMGRLKHSVKKLARTPSAEQRFENGRQVLSSRKGSFAASGTGSTVPSVLQSPVLSAAASTMTNSSAVVTTTTAMDSSATVGLGVQTAGGGSRPATPTSTTETASSSTKPRGTTQVGGDDADSQSSHTSDSIGNIGVLPNNISIDAIYAPPIGNTIMPLRAPHPPFTPPTDFDCPSTTIIPDHIPVIISEQSREASSSVDLYRGSVGGLAPDYLNLVPLMPNWALEVLLKNTIPMKETIKISFVLRPYKPALPGSEELGELPGGNPRLTAPRMLRIRKVLAHIVEKLELSGPQEGTVIPAPFDPMTVPTLPLTSTHTPTASSSSTETAATTADDQTQPPSESSAAQQQQHREETPTLSNTRALDPVKEEEPSDFKNQDQSAPRTTGDRDANSRNNNHSEATNSSNAQDTTPTTNSVASTSAALPTSSALATSSDNDSAAADAAAAIAAVRAAEAQQRLMEEENKRRLDLLRPENWLEVLCNDQVLPPTTSLMSARALYWKSGGDLILHYRYKASPSSA